jgi:hypothetical protein
MTTSSTAGQSVLSSFLCEPLPFCLNKNEHSDVDRITPGRLTNSGPFIEDDEEPDIQRRIAGRRISWNILQELGISATGTWPPGSFTVGGG